MTAKNIASYAGTAVADGSLAAREEVLLHSTKISYFASAMGKLCSAKRRAAAR